jgi:hypothetical protein
VLLIESTDLAVLRAIRSAVDRHVTLFEPKTLDDVASARRVLHCGDVVGLMMAAPASAAMADSLEGLRIPVRVDGNHLTFGDGAASPS